MLAGLQHAIEVRVAKGEAVFLVTHFPDTFTNLQDELEKLEVEFSILADPIDEAVVTKISESSPNRVHLTIAQMLSVQPTTGKKQQPQVAMMVCERHPMPFYDESIVEWCRQLMYPVELGYFLSFDDPVLKFVVNEQVKLLLEQFGWGENELITSNMVSRRLDKVLKRLAAKVANEEPAPSAAEWLELNYDN